MSDTGVGEISLELIWKSTPCGLALMESEGSMQASNGGKQSILLPSWKAPGL